MKDKIKAGSARAIQSQKVRFGLVGVVNTATDFIVLNVLVLAFGVPIVAANIMSTTAAMIVSFGLNKKAVFRGADSGNLRQITLFFVVTLTGLWLVQTVIMINVYNLFIAIGWPTSGMTLTIAKLVGICFGLTWNYIWYSRVVFRRGHE